MILALSDAHLVEFFSGQGVANVSDIRGQLKLVSERVMPAFSRELDGCPSERHPAGADTTSGRHARRPLDTGHGRTIA